MKQLSDEKIVEIARATKTAEPGRDGFVLPCAFARAIEAEVLRLNGIVEAKIPPVIPAVAVAQTSSYERCQKHLREAGKAYPRTCSVCGLWWPCRFEPQVHTVRATGCTETMDETGHFAEHELPGILRKQNPA